MCYSKKIEFVEKTLLSLGCKMVDIPKPSWDNRPIFEYQHQYYRIDSMSFSGKPFFVLECASTKEEVAHNIMEDIEPFPCDLSEEEMIKELKYALEIEPYPSDY